MDVFDFTQYTVQNFWINECLNQTLAHPNIVDGCFIDRAIEDHFPPPYNFTQEKLDNYTLGHNNVSLNLQKELTKHNKSVAITNRLVIDGVIATQLENFTATYEEIIKFQKYAKSGVLVQAHAGYKQLNTDNYCQDVNNSLAAFLIAAEKYSYYGCSRGWYIEPDWINWHYQYDLPLGEPLGDAIIIDNGKNNTFRREFAAGTIVELNYHTQVGNITWGTKEKLQKYKEMKKKQKAAMKF